MINILKRFYTSKFKATLNSKLNDLHKINAINNGGCAIAAYALVEFMKTEHNIQDATVVYLYPSCEEDGRYTNVLNNEAESCHHAVVKNGNEYYDSYGAYSANDLVVLKGLELFAEVSQEYVLNSINKSGWNSWFERETGVSEIFKILNISNEIKQTIKGA